MSCDVIGWLFGPNRMPPMDRPTKNTVTKAKANIPPLRGRRDIPHSCFPKVPGRVDSLFRLPQIGTKPNAPEPPNVAYRSSHKVATVTVRDAISRHFKLKPTQARFDPSTSLRNKASRRPDDRFPAGRH